jgi:hypothetical protein
MTELQHAVRFAKCFAKQLQCVPVEDLDVVDLDAAFADFCQVKGVAMTRERRLLLDDIQQAYAEQIAHDQAVPTWCALMDGLEMRGWRRCWLTRTL